LDYGFLPQNVSEVGKEKKRLRDPKVQIVTVGHYCDLKMAVSLAPSSCLSGAHVQPYIDLMEGLNTWRAQGYVSSSKTAEHFNRPRGIADL
jgi:hypothetical protein